MNKPNQTKSTNGGAAFREVRASEPARRDLNLRQSYPCRDALIERTEPVSLAGLEPGARLDRVARLSVAETFATIHALGGLRGETSRPSLRTLTVSAALNDGEGFRVSVDLFSARNVAESETYRVMVYAGHGETLPAAMLDTIDEMARDQDGISAFWASQESEGAA